MKPRRISTLLLTAALLAPAASGQDTRRQDLEEIRAEIARLQARMVRVTEESRGLSGELRRTEVALELQSTRLEEARAARLLAESLVEDLEAAVADLEQRLAALRTALRGRLADLYRLGRQGYLRLLLSIQSRQQLLPAIRVLRFLARRDGDLLERFLDTRAELTVERREMLRRRRERESWLAQERARFEELGRLRRHQATLLRRLEQQRESLTAETVRLTDKERKLSSLMDFLAGRAGAPLSGKPIQEFQGVLDWPAGGTVVQGFGTRLDPRYRTRTPHNGIALTTRAGESVRAVYPGRVLFAAPFQGYGQTVVVHHSGRVFTLYAGLRRLSVRQDDILRLGQPVGEATDRLYFEIREENRPVDPVNWLR